VISRTTVKTTRTDLRNSSLREPIEVELNRIIGTILDAPDDPVRLTRQLLASIQAITDASYCYVARTEALCDPVLIGALGSWPSLKEPTSIATDPHVALLNFASSESIYFETFCGGEGMGKTSCSEDAFRKFFLLENGDRIEALFHRTRSAGGNVMLLGAYPSLDQGGFDRGDPERHQVLHPFLEWILHRIDTLCLPNEVDACAYG